jgi:hypothetical protein
MNTRNTANSYLFNWHSRVWSIGPSVHLIKALGGGWHGQNLQETISPGDNL